MLRHFFSLSLNLNWSISSFPILSLWPLDLNHTIGSPGPPACWPQWFRLVRPHNPASEFLVLCVCVYRSFGEPGDLNMQPTLRATYLQITRQGNEWFCLGRRLHKSYHIWAEPERMSSICLAKQMRLEGRVLAKKAKRRGWKGGGVIGDEAKMEELGPDFDLLQISVAWQ